MRTNNIPVEGGLTKAAFIASLFAPLPLVIYFSVSLILEKGFQLFKLSDIFSFMLIIAPFALPFTCAVNFVLVVPMARLLRKRTSLSAIYLYLWCSLIAYPTFMIYMTLLNGGSAEAFDFLTITIYTLCGFCSGIVFCRIAKIRLKSVLSH